MKKKETQHNITQLPSPSGKSTMLHVQLLSFTPTAEKASFSSLGNRCCSYFVKFASIRGDVPVVSGCLCLYLSTSYENGFDRCSIFPKAGESFLRLLNIGIGEFHVKHDIKKIGDLSRDQFSRAHAEADKPTREV